MTLAIYSGLFRISVCYLLSLISLAQESTLGRHQSYFSGYPRKYAATEISISKIHGTNAAELEKLQDN